LQGLTSAIPKTLNIALEVKKNYKGTVDFSTSTCTVKVIGKLWFY